ncbi:MAG: hypothetical protein IKI67_04525 [Bacteroidales bacterium]|nr:hypothetical protein [Bacteroidales bacterium]
MEAKDIRYDCQRGCQVSCSQEGEIDCRYNTRCCKRGVFDWLKGLTDQEMENLFEVRFKNTRKGVYINDSQQALHVGDIVVTEAQNGYDVGIVTLSGAVVAHQLKRNNIDFRAFEFKKIYRKAKPADIQKWQEAIAREHQTMIRSRVIAANLGLEMKIGDVEFQGDGTKAIFYYIADGRVDFRQLIKDFAEEFRIRVEMKQIGARQEAGLIGGVGVCGQALCCSRYMNNFQSISTSAARCQDLSLNPQKLAGQCGKLKCCINYEAAVYLDAKEKMPRLSEPLHLEDGDIKPIKQDALKGIMWFSYIDRNSNDAYPLAVDKVLEIMQQNREGKLGASLSDSPKEKIIDFKSAAGEDSITRFDDMRKKKKGKQMRPRQPKRDRPQRERDKSEQQ